MAIHRGTKSIPRTHARNYTQSSVQKRFDEVIPQAQRQQLNALGVDSFEILLYQKGESSQVCTCQQVEVQQADFNNAGNLPPTLVHPAGDNTNPNVDAEIRIDFSRPLFGTPSENRTSEDLDDDLLEDYVEEADGSMTVDHVVQSSPDCGLCYKQGYVPGYTRYGAERLIYTNREIEDADAFTTDTSTTPSTLFPVDPNGWVLYLVSVPKYFKSLKYSVRNNRQILDVDITGANLAPLTVSDFRANAGRTMPVYIRGVAFTHLVMEFDLGTEPILANLAQLQRSTDWTTFDTLGNVNIILPVSVPKVNTSDVIVVPAKNTAFKISDTPTLQTAKGKPLDWSVNTRVLQPQEALKYIHKGYVLR